MTQASSDHRAAVARLSAFYGQLNPQDLDRLGDFYAPDARFKDPFNEVQGLPAIRQIFGHMFTALHDPRFVVTQQLVDGPQAFLVWEFRFRFRRFDTVTEQVVRGGSHLVLDSDGLVTLHRDYWDAAEELYEKLPGLGALMRWLRRRANQ
ncbi:nuclear transport factor 2 family protein [Hydrogenophaga sp. MI9]|uniref:nuclear transport factor 2 family protein n=1 Tax=Hydrogenophaga sp. MI9 TaxID=3453719 RepID=UPI003EEA134F